ncbi:PfkB family carbohydrate kinase [Desulfobacula toluolica]|uniref:Cytidyltransferase domain modulated carbohydrate/purine kinase n=1 Tax=Desulfobacula toluolica (strain DSM 7467 / Tol2) TaxID=651182 RepID=K0NRT6_DESTT|nr:PfkB family carbohydrate kinase [Desulfobacula toluolica]CCK81672.1 cytidyltransferase domain modulated carbohydrate/purine kinase [Desulfobacula toluolica Tol2]
MHPETKETLYFIKDRIKKKKIVFVSGNFNIIHPGHLRLLRFAAECGDFLIVGVHGNKTDGHTLMDEEFRLEGVNSITWVDFAFILRDSSEEFIKELKPSIVVKGTEHEAVYNPESEAVKSYGGKLLFSSGDMSFSLVELLQDESKRLISPAIVRHDAFMKRHGFDWYDLCRTLKGFEQLKVSVIGDIIVDEYINCDPLGMSQEDPSIVVTPVAKNKYIGGAGIVAAHARKMGADVSFFSVAGSDETVQFAQSKLDEYAVQSFIIEDESRPTILKQRFRCSGKTLLRINHLRSHPISKELQKQMQNNLFELLDEIDILIFSDFNYGILPQPLVDNVIKRCRQKDIMMVADSQSSSQIGDVSRFNHMFFLTPTEREARLAVRDFESGLVVLAEKLRKQALAENIFITLDKEGMLIHEGVPNRDQWETDRLNAMNPVATDPAGAGDSLLTCSALAAALGADIWQCAYLGSLAAACQVERIGNIPISIEDMMAKISK